MPEDARIMHGGEAGTLLRNVRKPKLVAFNPWMSVNTMCSMVEILDALPATNEGDREVLAWL